MPTDGKMPVHGEAMSCYLCPVNHPLNGDGTLRVRCMILKYSFSIFLLIIVLIAFEVSINYY